MALWWGEWRPPPRGLMPHPDVLHPEPLPLRQATADPCLLRRHSHTVLSQSLWSLRVLVCTRFCCALQESISPSCVSSGSSMVGLVAISSKRAYATPGSAAPRAPVPGAGHRQPAPPQELPRHSSVSVSVGSLGPGAHKVCLSPLSISGGDVV